MPVKRKRNDSHSIAQRRNAIVDLLPTDANAAVSTRILHERLQSEFDIDARSVQRDLQHLEALGRVQATRQGNSKHYHRTHITRPASTLSQEEALSLLMAKHFLANLMPSGLFDALEPLYEQAKAALKKTEYERWMKSVRWVSETQRLLPPEIDPRVRSAVETGLLKGKQLALRYLTRDGNEPKTYNAHPLGLVAKGPRLYLVATLRDYVDIKYLAVHRIISAALLDAEAVRPASFDIDRYLETTAEIGIPTGPEIELHAIFKNKAGNHLFETPLATNQQLFFRDPACETVELMAKVKQTMQLLWWLRGFGGDVQVLSPEMG